ncbi:MAG: hypothetical protein KF729_02595 [Sandaracinaceae bacterium]|nr:hypothetical protein [Sandaracinaceae bacterium]
MRLALALLVLSACDAPIAPASDGGAPDDAALVADASAALDASPLDASAHPDASPPDASAPDAGPPFEPPASIFFVGNSFTFGGPIPTIVEDLAAYAGWPEPEVDYRAVPGQTLAFHRADTDPANAPDRIREGWDVVVLQEQSTRPTDQLGDPDRFKADATWFYDLAKSVNARARVVLFETWARRFDHAYYPGSFSDPAMMQAELRFHYYDAAERYIPAFSAAAVTSDVRVAPCGDAWELQLAGGEPPRLHAEDSWHAAAPGQYLNALVLYGTIYQSLTEGLVPLRGLDAATAAMLQASADRVTGARGRGPAFGMATALEAGDELRVDLGPDFVDGWPALTATRGTIGPLATVGGAPSSARATAWAFDGTQEGGRADNALGLPGAVSRDTLWIGSFDGHAAALRREARLVVRGLPPGRYRVELFASRDGNDGGRGRVTRFTLGAEHRDLDVADNRERVAAFEDVAPDARDELLVRVTVAPDGSSRFAYLGAVRITRL